MKSNLKNIHPFALNAGFLDIETFGLEKGSPVWEAAWYDLQTGKVRRWSIRPHAGKEAIAADAAAESMEPWTRARFEGQPSTRAGIAASFAEGSSTPGNFLRELFAEIQGKQVWIANAPFESRQLGAMARDHLSDEELVKFSKQFQTAPAGKGNIGNMFYVTGRRVQAARGAAYATGDWASVIEQYAKSGAGASTKVRDVQDVARSVFSQAMDLGIFSQKGTYTGTSINVMGMAMGMEAETHRAAGDVVQEAKVLFGPRLGKAGTPGGLLGLNQRMSGLNQGFMGAIGALFSPGAKDDLQVMKRLEAVRPELKHRAIRRALADAKLEIRTGKGVEVVTGRRSWEAPVFTHGSPFVRSTPISVANKVRTKKWSEAVEYLKTVHMNGSEGFDWDGEASKVNRMRTSKLEALKHTGVSLEAEAQLNKKLLSKMDAAGKWGLRDSAALLARKYPFKSAGTLTAAVIGFEVLTSFMSPDKDERLVAEGLSELGVAPQLRKQNTEFGSGYQGMGTPWFFRVQQEREYRAQQAKWERDVWQEPGRFAVEQMMIKEAQTKAQSKLGRIPLGAGITYTPEQVKAIQDASGGALLSGVNPMLQKRLAVVDISKDKYKYEFDDADTLMLRRKNFLGFGTGKKISIRLAGIDAPETGGHANDPLEPVRVGQDQPHGKVSAEQFEEIIRAQGSLTLAYDPEASTYGRQIGFLYGEDQQNINLQLVRGGQAAHLPFGDSGSSIVDRGQFQRAEDVASGSRSGMWGDPFWQAQKIAMDEAGSRVTFNTMTRMDKLAKDAALQQMTMSAWGAHERGYIEDEQEFVDYGFRLRSTVGRFNSRNKKRAKRKGNPRAHNDIQGFQHGGIASEYRPMFGFGSPSIGKIAPMVLDLWSSLRPMGDALRSGGLGKRNLEKALPSPSYGPGARGTVKSLKGEYTEAFGGEPFAVAGLILDEAATASSMGRETFEARVKGMFTEEARTGGISASLINPAKEGHDFIFKNTPLGFLYSSGQVDTWATKDIGSTLTASGRRVADNIDEPVSALASQATQNEMILRDYKVRSGFFRDPLTFSSVRADGIRETAAYNDNKISKEILDTFTSTLEKKGIPLTELTPQGVLSLDKDELAGRILRTKTETSTSMTPWGEPRTQTYETSRHQKVRDPSSNVLYGLGRGRIAPADYRDMLSGLGSIDAVEGALLQNLDAKSFFSQKAGGAKIEGKHLQRAVSKTRSQARKMRMARAQTAASKDQFSSPINHHRGGS